MNIRNDAGIDNRRGARVDHRDRNAAGYSCAAGTDRWNRGGGCRRTGGRVGHGTRARIDNRPRGGTDYLFAARTDHSNRRGRRHRNRGRVSWDHRGESRVAPMAKPRLITS